MIRNVGPDVGDDAFENITTVVTSKLIKQRYSGWIHFKRRYFSKKKLIPNNKNKTEGSNHEKSKKLESVLRSHALDKMVELQETEGETWVDCQYILDATEQLIEVKIDMVFSPLTFL